MRGYSAYLFDFDYTLADSSKGILTCFRNVLTRNGFINVSDEDIKRTIGKTLQDSFSILTGVSDKDQLEIFRKEYVKEADTYMTANTILFLETKSVLRALKDAGAYIGIISTKYRYRIKELLDQHLPSDYFNIIIGGEDVLEAKPSPEGLLLAIKQLDIPKEEVLYIGDSTIDAETAEAAGVDFAGVLHGVTTAEQLREYPHVKIMNTLEDLFENQSPVMTEDKHKDKKPKDSPTPQKTRKRLLKTIALALTGLLAVSELIVSGTCAFLIIFLLILLFNVRPSEVSIFLKRFAPGSINTIESYIRLFHFKQIRGHSTHSIGQEVITCLNCNNTYTGNYCNRCGQGKEVTRLSFRHGLKNIVGGLSHMEHGFWGTLMELLYRPGYMINDFIKGKRVHHLGPFHALFLLAAIYILLVKFVDPNALAHEDANENQTEQITTVRNQLQQRLDTTKNVQQKAAIMQLQKYLNTTESSSKSIDKKDTVEVKSENTIEDLAENQGQVYERISQKLSHIPFFQKVWDLLHHWAHGNKAASIIVTLPLFALATRMAFRKRVYLPNLNTTEHLFIQAYIASQILLISCIYFPFNGKAQLNELYDIPYWLIFIIFWWDYKQLFRSTWTKSFIRTILMFWYSLLIIILLATVLIAIIIGGLFLLKAFGF